MRPWIVLVFGAALIVFGAIVLVRRPYLPGGKLEYRGLKVDSAGAGIPLIALGVVVLLTANLVWPVRSVDDTRESSNPPESSTEGGTSDGDRSTPAPRSAGPDNAPRTTPSSPGKAVVRLDELEPVAGGFLDEGLQKVDGQTYEHTVTMTSCDPSYPEEVEYDLSRQYQTFSSIVGVPDDSPTSATAHYKVYGDGELLKETEASFGKPANLETSVAGVLRLRLTATCDSSDEIFLTAVWADPTLVRRV